MFIFEPIQEYFVFFLKFALKAQMFVTWSWLQVRLRHTVLQFLRQAGTCAMDTSLHNCKKLSLCTSESDENNCVDDISTYVT
jgi:hypothetical protein